MLLFVIILIFSVIGIGGGIVRENRRLLTISLIGFSADVILFVIGSILYAMYE